MANVKRAKIMVEGVVEQSIIDSEVVRLLVLGLADSRRAVDRFLGPFGR